MTKRADSRRSAPESSGERLLSQTAAAERLGITTRWLRELTKQGAIPSAGTSTRPRYPWPATRVAYDAYQRSVWEQAHGPVNLKQERAAKLAAERELLEYKLAEKRRTMIRTDEAIRLIEGDYAIVRRQILNVPGKWATRFAPQMTRGQALRQLEAMTDELLGDLQGCAERLESGEIDTIDSETTEAVG